MGRSILKQKNPQHIAIVMDGNGRWAASRKLPRIEGHRQGVLVVKDIIQACLKHQIPVLSLFTFSHENWARPAEEVNFLMALFLNSLTNELDGLIEHGIRLRFLGSRQELTANLIEQMQHAEHLTAKNHGLTLNIALNYSGKWDILQAVEKLLATKVDSNHSTEDLLSANLCTYGLPDPDLFIRTSGEQRISNFFLWQLAYTELYFTEVFWPDFNAQCFEKALEFYQSRERRFGKTSQQLQDGEYV